ncbi:MAG: hypothetical protein ACHWZW_03095 [Spirulina sp.]
MIKPLRILAWLLTIAMLFKMLEYRIPFAHHLEGVIQPDVENNGDEPPPPPVDPFQEDPVANGFDEFWSDAP